MSDATLARLTIGLSLAGFVIALYFTLAYYGRAKKARWVPKVLCPRAESNCVTVVQTPYARIFRVPNSLLGAIYYLALIVWISLPTNEAHWYATHLEFVELTGKILLAAGAAAVLLGFYLIYALRRILRTDCPLCYTAHAINAALLVLLIFLAR